VHHFSVSDSCCHCSGSGSPAQQAPDPEATLQPHWATLAGGTDRMPRYTCVQTITRTTTMQGQNFTGLPVQAYRGARNTETSARALGWEPPSAGSWHSPGQQRIFLGRRTQIY